MENKTELSGKLSNVELAAFRLNRLSQRYRGNVVNIERSADFNRPDALLYKGLRNRHKEQKLLWVVSAYFDLTQFPDVDLDQVIHKSKDTINVDESGSGREAAVRILPAIQYWARMSHGADGKEYDNVQTSLTNGEYIKVIDAYNAGVTILREMIKVCDPDYQQLVINQTDPKILI